MQQLERITAVFCTACICAEVLTQWTESGWPRRCIKAVAGLYILVVLSSQLPWIRHAASSVAGLAPSAVPVELGSFDDAVLREAETELTQRLAAECTAACGVDVELSVTFVETPAGYAASVEAKLPAGCSDTTREQVREVLRAALGTEPTFKEQEVGG